MSDSTHDFEARLIVAEKKSKKLDGYVQTFKYTLDQYKILEPRLPKRKKKEYPIEPFEPRIRVAQGLCKLMEEYAAELEEFDQSCSSLRSILAENEAVSEQETQETNVLAAYVPRVLDIESQRETYHAKHAIWMDSLPQFQTVAGILPNPYSSEDPILRLTDEGNIEPQPPEAAAPPRPSAPKRKRANKKS